MRALTLLGVPWLFGAAVWLYIWSWRNYGLPLSTNTPLDWLATYPAALAAAVAYLAIGGEKELPRGQLRRLMEGFAAAVLYWFTYMFLQTSFMPPR